MEVNEDNSYLVLMEIKNYNHNIEQSPPSSSKVRMSKYASIIWYVHVSQGTKNFHRQLCFKNNEHLVLSGI